MNANEVFDQGLEVRKDILATISSTTAVACPVCVRKQVQLRNGINIYFHALNMLDIGEHPIMLI